MSPHLPNLLHHLQHPLLDSTLAHFMIIIQHYHLLEYLLDGDHVNRYGEFISKIYIQLISVISFWDDESDKVVSTTN